MDILLKHCPDCDEDLPLWQYYVEKHKNGRSYVEKLCMGCKNYRRQEHHRRTVPRTQRLSLEKKKSAREIRDINVDLLSNLLTINQIALKYDLTYNDVYRYYHARLVPV